MRFRDIKPDSPWFVSEETQALLALIRDRREMAVGGAVSAVRDNFAHVAAGHVGAADAYRGLIIELQPTTREGT